MKEHYNDLLGETIILLDKGEFISCDKNGLVAYTKRENRIMKDKSDEEKKALHLIKKYFDGEVLY